MSTSYPPRSAQDTAMHFGPPSNPCIINKVATRREGLRSSAQRLVPIYLNQVVQLPPKEYNTLSGAKVNEREPEDRQNPILQWVEQLVSLPKSKWISVEQPEVFKDLVVCEISHEIGRGVFASKLIPKGTSLGFYGGDYRIDDGSRLPPYDEYAFIIDKQRDGDATLKIDGAAGKGNVLSLINGVKDNSLANIGAYQVLIKDKGKNWPQIEYIAEKDILPGHQLLVHYGDKFPWGNRPYEELTPQKYQLARSLLGHVQPAQLAQAPETPQRIAPQALPAALISAKPLLQLAAPQTFPTSASSPSQQAVPQALPAALISASSPSQLAAPLSAAPRQGVKRFRPPEFDGGDDRTSDVREPQKKPKRQADEEENPIHEKAQDILKDLLNARRFETKLRRGVVQEKSTPSSPSSHIFGATWFQRIFAEFLNSGITTYFEDSTTGRENLMKTTERVFRKLVLNPILPASQSRNVGLEDISNLRVFEEMEKTFIKLLPKVRKAIHSKDYTSLSKPPNKSYVYHKRENWKVLVSKIFPGHAGRISFSTVMSHLVVSNVELCVNRIFAKMCEIEPVKDILFSKKDQVMQLFKNVSSTHRDQTKKLPEEYLNQLEGYFNALDPKKPNKKTID